MSFYSLSSYSQLRINRSAIGGTPTPPPFSNVNSFSFDGIDDYFTGVGTYSELDGQNKGTFSMWIKPTLSANALALYVPSSPSSIAYTIVAYNTGYLRFLMQNSGLYVTTNTGALTANVWQHIMICIDLSLAFSNRGAIFVNGADVTSGNNLNRTTFTTSSGELQLSGRDEASPLYYEGQMDEVAIWSGTDQRANVSEIYGGGQAVDLNNLATAPQPTTWLRMGDLASWNGATWTMTDVNGGYTNRSINMVEANRTTDVPSASSFTNTKSIQLDGVDDYVDCGNDSSLNLTSQITWSAWVKFNALNNAVNYGIVSNFDPNEGYNYTFIYYPSTTSSSRKLRLRINSSSGSLSGYYDTSVDLSDNQWHHVAFSFDGTTNANGIKVYVDGVNVNSFTSSNAGIFSSSGSTLIGAYQTASWFANANIDEVSVFNSALSQSDVTAIYGGGNPSSLSSYSSLVSWWRCGDGDVSPILTDNGSGGNNGTMTNFSTFSTDVPT